MSDKIESAVGAIKELIAIFRFERIVYLIITIICVLVLIITAVSLIYGSESKENTIEIMGLFGSTGGIVYSTGRLLKMWSEALQLIQAAIQQNNG